MMLSCVTHRPWRFSWRSRRFDSGLAAVLLLSVSAGLTQPTRALRGRVKDEQGQSLLVPSYSSRAMRYFGFALITERDGQYHFEELSANVTYRVGAAYKGRLSRTGKLTRLDSRSPATIDLRIDLSRAILREVTPSRGVSKWV
jgi:hypothetical protein